MDTLSSAFFIILHSSTKDNHLVYFCLPELHESGKEANCPVFDHSQYVKHTSDQTECCREGMETRLIKQCSQAHDMAHDMPQCCFIVDQEIFASCLGGKN